ncbi:MAG: transposase [Candidatus Paracaedibacteraceae bacterium]|nr:transposase [Candidatus Paracaedibacteraceae bacterium]
MYLADSTGLKVCHSQRIFNHKVFDGLTQRGKTTIRWFFGLKLHLSFIIRANHGCQNNP